MNNPAEKKAPEEIKTGRKQKALEKSKKGEKMELTDEEAENVVGGASFEFYDRENSNPK